MVIRRLVFELELVRWRRAGQRAQLWWRDDDARVPTPALDRLLGLATRYNAPLTLAVVPDREPEHLRAVLEPAAKVTVSQHGVDHQNRREGVSAGEFGDDWSRAQIADRLRVGWARLRPLPGAIPIYVPPWNHVHPDLPAALRDVGYAGWSSRGDDDPRDGPPRVDVHLDLLRWKKGVRFRGEAAFLRAFGRELARRRRSADWNRPIGLLTHHLDHDEAAWRFLEWLLARTQGERAMAWRSLPELLDGA